MKSHARSGAFPKSLILLTATAAVLLLGADIAHRAKDGHGRWHQIARSLVHAVKGSQAQAAELPTERADAPMVIYDDTLGDGWQDWSWGTKDFQYSRRVHSGTAAIYLDPTGNSGNRGIYLHHDAFGTGGYGTLQAFVYGDTTRVCLVDDGGKFLPYATVTPYLKPDPAGKPGWHLVRIPLADLGAPRSGQAISGIVFQPEVTAPQALILDDVSLLPDLTLSPAPISATVAITVTASAGRHPISPFIYGMAFAPDDYLQDLRLPLNRWGATTKAATTGCRAMPTTPRVTGVFATVMRPMVRCRPARRPPPTALWPATRRGARPHC